MEFSHFDESGSACMVDISDKEITERICKACGYINLKTTTIDKIKQKLIKKGDVFSVAKISGIMAAKETSRLIPLSHNIQLTYVDVDFNVFENKIEAISIVKTNGRTGAEMEALIAVSNSLLTIYDMCKAVDKGMTIENIKLIEKRKICKNKELLNQ